MQLRTILKCTPFIFVLALSLTACGGALANPWVSFLGKTPAEIKEEMRAAFECHDQAYVVLLGDLEPNTTIRRDFTRPLENLGPVNTQSEAGHGLRKIHCTSAILSTDFFYFSGYRQVFRIVATYHRGLCSELFQTYFKCSARMLAQREYDKKKLAALKAPIGYTSQGPGPKSNELHFARVYDDFFRDETLKDLLIDAICTGELHPPKNFSFRCGISAELHGNIFITTSVYEIFKKRPFGIEREVSTLVSNEAATDIAKYNEYLSEYFEFFRMKYLPLIEKLKAEKNAKGDVLDEILGR